MKSRSRSIMKAFSAFGLATVAMAMVVGADALLSFTSEARADDDRRRSSCSMRSLRGSYGVKFEGVRLPDTKLNSVALVKFDGVGKVEVSEKGRFGGSSLSRTFTAPYIVLPDCTGALDFSNQPGIPPGIFHVPFVIVDDGKELFFVVDADGFQIGAIGKRL